ncbi:MAG: VOC family protein [Ilumatobacter sp.]|uniref:VOC family protein n=1 Tax=Ilumatobacter sp. TaxID=1967498 RepID=UPI003919151A
MDARVDARVEWLEIAGDAAAWRSIGLVVADDGLIPLIGTGLRIVDAGEHSNGIVGWALSGVSDDLDQATIDGLRTTTVASPGPVYADHPLGASGLDHVVVMTADLERTSAAIGAATSCELKRIREVDTMRQGFHRIGRGGLIVELVERPDVPAGPASFWGLVINVDDLDGACDRIGRDLISEPKDAVQPGRRIATVRSEVGLGLPVALMTP